MLDDCSRVALSDLGVLRVSGADALAFLQGQLSQDMQRLTPARALLAGLHNPQGRVIAVLRLLQPVAGEVLALLPRELLPAVLARLRKFVLRAKVQLSDDSAAWQVWGLWSARPVAALAHQPGMVVQRDGALALRLDGGAPRWLLVQPAAAPCAAGAGVDASYELWQQQAIAAGEPQVYGATSEEFVAQMLNLDLLGGIAFDKGCYTGQEVIARAHYRGRVKRRLQRFRSSAPQQLAAGARATLGDGRQVQVVNAVRLADGRCEFLAVAPLAGAAEPAAAGAAILDAEPLPLPYVLPQ
jgi:tRNA-modifying protein YgfZ